MITERKGGRGGTDMAVSVAWACKLWHFKPAVVWLPSINHFCAPSQSQTKLVNLGWEGGGHLSPVPRLWGWSVCPIPIFHSGFASIANFM